MSGEQIMVVVIVAMAILGSIYKARYYGGRRRKMAAGDAQDADATRLRSEVRTLKERIAVLERITTDKESSLEREIERLRDR